MTIFELGALGEFIGSIAILVTLIAIYFQVRQQSVQQQAEALDSAFGGFEIINAAFINNPETAAVALKMQNEPDALNDIERIQAYSISSSVLWAWKLIHARINFGMFPEFDNEYVVVNLRQFLTDANLQGGLERQANTVW